MQSEEEELALIEQSPAEFGLRNLCLCGYVDSRLRTSDLLSR